jgi:hypothetical protein
MPVVRIVNSTCPGSVVVGTLRVHMTRPEPSRSTPPEAASLWRRCRQALAGPSPQKSAVERPNAKAQPEQRPAASSAEVTDHPLLTDLTTLLDAVAGSRKMLRHLAGVEHGLRKKDPTGMFLFRIEPGVLRTALRQLDGLLSPTPPRGLSALRARMASALAAHDKREREREMLAPRSDLMQAHKLEVAEASASDFDRLSAQFQSRPTGS